MDDANPSLFAAFCPPAIADATRASGQRWLTATAQRHRRPHPAVAAASPMPPAEQSIEQRVDWVLTGAGFPPLLVEHGRVILSGFVVTPERVNSARVRWVGAREINSLPYRRTFLSAYGPALARAGLTVVEANGDGEPYLVCRNTPSIS